MKIRIIHTLIVYLFSVTFTMAQSSADLSTSTTSSYSIFGLGEELNNGTAENMGKGGLATAVISNFSPSFNNAASFYHNKLSTFQVGVKLSERQQITNNTKNWSNNGALNYVQLAFPINKWWGSGIGLLPLHGQGYNISNDSVQTSFGLAKYTNNGQGTLNSLVWSNGINPFKWFSDSIADNFSLGLGMSYLFGNTSNYDKIVYNDYLTKGYYNQLNTNYDVYNGFNFNLGVINKFRVAKKMELSLGASYNFISKINTDNVQNTYYFANDTVRSTSVLTKHITVPSKFSIGATLSIKSNLQIGLEYKKAMWSQYKNEARPSTLKDATTYIIGVEYNPHVANGNFFKNTNYRIGARYTQNPYVIGTNKISEKAITIGFGLPIKKSFSTVNIGLEAMQRGTMKDGLVLENYFSAYVGLTINDRWFIKQKYD